MGKDCVNHAASPAVATCKVCEKPLCLMCTTEEGGVVFCSPQCVDVYGEVKDWIEPKAKPEEWNPLAEPSMMTAPVQLPDDDTALELEKAAAPVAPLPEDESVLDATKLRPPPPSRPKVHRGVWIGVAASLAVAMGILAIGRGKEKKGEPIQPPVAHVEPSKPPAVVVEPLRPVVPKVEPPKPPPPVAVEPPKPVVPKVEPPKPPPPVVVEPPKPVVPKVEPPKPSPVVVVEPPKPVVPKVEPPKPPPVVIEPPPPLPAVADPPRPIPPKVEPPRPAPPSAEVRKSLDRAAAHVREAVPLFAEVLEGLEAGGSGKAAMGGLLEKAERVRRSLYEARKLYSDVAPAAADPGIIEGRIRRIDTLLETTAGCVEQIKSRL